MLRTLRPRSIYDVMAAIACFGVLAGGSAYAANTISSADIIDNEVRSADVRDDTSSGGGLSGGDIANGAMTTLEIRDANQPFGGLFSQDLAAGSVRGSEVSNGSLNDEDIAQVSGTNVDLEVTIGQVAANDCKDVFVSGLDARGDHLLLTPDWETTNSGLSYGVEYRDSRDEVALKVCNPHTFALDGGSSNFNLLEIDAN